MTVSATILCPADCISDVTDKARMCGGDSSVGRAADWKARCNTDAGSSPRCGKGFFSPSQLPAQPLVCHDPHQHLCMRYKSPTLAAIPLFGRRKIPHRQEWVALLLRLLCLTELRQPVFSARNKEVLKKKKKRVLNASWTSLFLFLMGKECKPLSVWLHPEELKLKAKQKVLFLV